MQTLHTVIITSNEPWGELWVSKHHYANTLAKLGHRVYFLNAPEYWRPSHLFSFSVKTEKNNDNLTVVDYRNNFPVRIFKSFFLRLNDLSNSLKISRLIGPRQDVIWWQFDPYRFVNIYFFNNYKRIYHVVDPYRHIWSDPRLAQKADLVVSLLEEYNEYYLQFNRNIINIPHGIAGTEYDINEKEVENIKNKYGKFILLTGTIADDTNIDLLHSISSRFENTLLLIGPMKLQNEKKVSSFEKLLKQKNVQWPGQIKAADLKNYVKASSVCIIPYDFSDKDARASSLKTINYLAQHKVIISSKRSGFENLTGKGIYFAKNEEEFLNLTSQGISGKLTPDVTVIDNYLRTLNYPDLIDRILNKI